jgi:NAD(P)-dependent dehydrogenase (short-subunit alcohol dehydrogenase family)
MRLPDKIGLVTGAASGMGRAGAIRFASEGACVGVVDINGDGVNEVVKEIRAAGGRAIPLVGDLTGDDFSRAIVAETVKAFGGLDFAWCHAGHPGPAEIEKIDMELWDLSVDLNLRTALVTTSAAIPEIRKRTQAGHAGGSLLYTSSTSGLRGSPHSPVYSAMKFGIIGFMRSLAARYAKENIRANVLCPGAIDTPMTRTFQRRPDDTKNANVDMEDLLARKARLTPMGRFSQPPEIANLALFLVSDEASWVSGAAIPIDGATVA